MKSTCTWNQSGLEHSSILMVITWWSRVAGKNVCSIEGLYYYIRGRDSFFAFPQEKARGYPMQTIDLHGQQREILQREQQIATALQACLVGMEGVDAYATTLQQVTSSLDELFLLVIVGEFNSGKSALINA